MTASEARTKMRKERAKKSVARIFPVIDNAIKKGLGSLRLSIQCGADLSSKSSLTEEEFEILEKEYGYKLEALYDGSGDYHKSDKKWAYNVIWE